MTQGLERSIAALRAESLALRIHVQELEHLLLEPGEYRLALAAAAADNGHSA